MGKIKGSDEIKMNYLDELSSLENKTDLTLNDIKEFEHKINNVDLDEKMTAYIKSKILKLKLKCNSGSKKWDLFLNEIAEYENIDEVMEFLLELDELKDEYVCQEKLNELENTYSKTILQILHDPSKLSKYYRDLCIKEVNKKLKVFHNRIERTINPAFGEKIRQLREEKGKSFNYLLELRIPCISFQDYVYPIDSSFNTVDYRVEILKESNMDKNLYYFAAHSGNGKYSYFNRLIELKIGDVIILHLFNHQLHYVVSDGYLINKKGYMISNGESDTLYLITCSLVDKKKQLIIQANLT